MIRCIQCGRADLETRTIQLAGKVRDRDYTVEMRGLQCPRCGYKTIEGSDMPEFGRLLADQYRAEHGLLTSEELRARRKRLGLSQREFALHVGVGLATIKRAEMGKIQDGRTDEAIRRKTVQHHAAQIGGFYTIVTSTNTNCQGYYLGDIAQPSYHFSSTNLPSRRAIPPYLANLLNVSTHG
ncbi:MAG: type II toxin-antitoxin system MqsA family antitoxin [Acidobacteriia bacterium]|nr:type II toxin-antitoxin system MqsA family antitoxin [Terriglobia bacterium]